MLFYLLSCKASQEAWLKPFRVGKKRREKELQSLTNKTRYHFFIIHIIGRERPQLGSGWVHRGFSWSQNKGRNSGDSSLCPIYSQQSSNNFGKPHFIGFYCSTPYPRAVSLIQGIPVTQTFSTHHSLPEGPGFLANESLSWLEDPTSKLGFLPSIWTMRRSLPW